MERQFRQALKVVRETLPYLLYRARIFAAVSAAAALYLVLLLLASTVFGVGVFACILLLSVWLMHSLGILNEYVFAGLRAGYIALAAEVIAEGRFPKGVSYVKWARESVNQCFTNTTQLGRARQTVTSILDAVNRNMFDSASVLPVREFERDTRLTRGIISLSQDYVTDAAVAYSLKTKNDNVSDAMRAAIVIYCQAWKTVLAQAVRLTLLGYAFFVAASVVCLAPLGVLALEISDVSMNVRLALFVTGVFLGFSAKWIIYDPFAYAAIILGFFEECELLTADPALEKEIEAKAEDFRELKASAVKKAAEDKRKRKRTRARRAS